MPDAPPFLTGMHGAPFFVAPEMVRHDSFHAWPVDVYSVGVVAYTLLTGSLPTLASGACARAAVVDRYLVLSARLQRTRPAAVQASTACSALAAGKLSRAWMPPIPGWWQPTVLSLSSADRAQRCRGLCEAVLRAGPAQARHCRCTVGASVSPAKVRSAGPEEGRGRMSTGEVCERVVVELRGGGRGRDAAHQDWRGSGTGAAFVALVAAWPRVDSAAGAGAHTPFPTHLAVLTAHHHTQTGAAIKLGLSSPLSHVRVFAPLPPNCSSQQPPELAAREGRAASEAVASAERLDAAVQAVRRRLDAIKGQLEPLASRVPAPAAPVVVAPPPNAPLPELRVTFEKGDELDLFCWRLCEWGMRAVAGHRLNITCRGAWSPPCAWLAAHHRHQPTGTRRSTRSREATGWRCAAFRSHARRSSIASPGRASGTRPRPHRVPTESGSWWRTSPKPR